jgi:hypothetical protein
MRILGCALASVLALAVCVAVASEPPAADDTTIQKLIADLGAKETATRDAAQKRLIEIGVSTRPALLAAAKSDDPEIRTRAAETLAATVEVTIKDLGNCGARSNYDLRISPNGEHAAWWVPLDKGAALVVDGKEGQPWETAYDGNASGHLPTTLCNDGAMAYWARNGDKCYNVISEQEDKAIETGDGNQVAPVRTFDGKHLAYTLKTAAGKIAVIRDGKEGPHYESISNLLFSAAGSALVYSARDKAGDFVILNDKPLGPYPSISRLRLSPDGKRLAFVVIRDDKSSLVSDGKEGPAFKNIEEVLFSPDSAGLAYVGRSIEDTTRHIFWDGREVAKTPLWAHLAFSSDGKRLAWTGGAREVCILDRGQDKPKTFPVTEDHAATGPATFSPDGQHLAYGVASGNGWYVSVDGQNFLARYDIFDYVLPSPPRPGQKIDPQEYVFLKAPGFSADGRHLYVVGCRKAKDSQALRFFMVVDGQARPEHDGVWLPEGFQTGAKTLRYVVRDGEKLRQVETYWPEDLTWEKAAGKPTNK